MLGDEEHTRLIVDSATVGDQTTLVEVVPFVFFHIAGHRSGRDRKRVRHTRVVQVFKSCPCHLVKEAR